MYIFICIWLWWIVGLYVIGRSIGKVGGAWLGARLSKADPVVQRYSGLGLLAQGGVAIGLSIMAAHKLQGIQVADGLALGDVIIFGITTTTFLVQIIGPACVKIAVNRADEAGRNITAEDIAASLRLTEIKLSKEHRVRAFSRIRDVIAMFTETGATSIPVVDAEDRLAGVIGVEELRDLILKEQTWDWLVAEDVLAQPHATLHPGQSLKESLRTLEQLDMSEAPVVDDDGLYLGNVHRSDMREMINNQLVRNQIKTT